MGHIYNRSIPEKKLIDVNIYYVGSMYVKSHFTYTPGPRVSLFCQVTENWTEV